MNTKINYKPNHKADLIKRHLMYLFDDKASTMLKILAVEFLYPYRNEDHILEKLEYFYKKERDVYLKDLLKKAINGNLENFLETDFEYAKDDQETKQRHFTINKDNVLTSHQIALMKHFSK